MLLFHHAVDIDRPVPDLHHNSPWPTNAVINADDGAPSNPVGLVDCKFNPAHAVQHCHLIHDAINCRPLSFRDFGVLRNSL